MQKLNKLFLITSAALLALLMLEVDAQPVREPKVLEITYNKTTSLVFPAIIKSVDRGSRDILAQKASEVENILQLKAARHGFPQTNLTVITSDGIIREFTIAYAKEPESLVVNIADEPDDGLRKPNLIFQADMTETEMEEYASRIVHAKRSIRFVNEFNHKIGLSLRGIYIKGDVIFYHFRFSNASNIRYDVDFLRFYVHDRQRVKRTAAQEIDINPIYRYGHADRISGQTSEDVVYALEKFTIPDAKRLAVEVFEKNGGRDLRLSVRNKTIVNARRLD